MLAARLIRLVETHADELVQVVLHDLRTNPRTASFTRVPEADLRHRLHWSLWRHRHQHRVGTSHYHRRRATTA